MSGVDREAAKWWKGLATQELLDLLEELQPLAAKFVAGTGMSMKDSLDHDTVVFELLERVK